MGYILRDEIIIRRPIVFLCGPYCQKTNKSDRRNILRKCFKDNFKDGVLPLIIDDFLTEENIKDPQINIQLMEEIFASISQKTYIFLDTLSAASELGLFMNHAFLNKVVAYIPKESDILNKKNVGYFVKDVILKMNSRQAKYIEYRPAITRSVIATDYAVEHYGFIDDIVPENIRRDLLDDIALKTKKVHLICLDEKETTPMDDYRICYRRKENRFFLNVSISLVFYIVASLMYEKYSAKLVTNPNASIKDFDVDDILRMTTDTFDNYLLRKGLPTNEDIEINTILKCSFRDLIYHIVTFCYIYHCFSTYMGLRLVDRHMDTILEPYADKKMGNPLEIFDISVQDYDFLIQCQKNPEEFYSKFYLLKNGKRREFIKYSETETGKKLRKIHERINDALRKNYVSSEKSYAYKKGSSIKKCVELHQNNNGFIKYDISSFFNSIDMDILLDAVMNIFSINFAYKKVMRNIISSFYYEGMLPLGLVISPVLSDIYMLKFDQQIIEYCEKKNYKYTRYADDILISKETEFETVEYDEIDDLVIKWLRQLKLKLNSKKKKRLFLQKDGQHIKYIGVNIVHFAKGNKLSVGRQYIYDVVKEYYNYREQARKLREYGIGDETHLFYEERRISGKIAFIKAIEGADGWEKVRKRIGDKEGLYIDEKLKFYHIS